MIYLSLTTIHIRNIVNKFENIITKKPSIKMNIPEKEKEIVLL